MSDITIYCAINEISGSVYIGRTKLGMPRRKNQHIKSSRKPKSPFHLAIRKYGTEAFSWHELYICSENDCIEAETFFINEFRSDGYKLYNLGDGSFGGDILTGHPRRQEIINKIKESNSISQKDPIYRKRFSEMAKEKGYGKWMKGKVLTDEHKKNISAGIKAALQCEEKRQKISHRGSKKKFSETHKENLSKSAKGKEKSSSHKEALSRALKGKKLSKEHCDKIKEGLRKRREYANISATA